MYGGGGIGSQKRREGFAQGRLDDAERDLEHRSCWWWRGGKRAWSGTGDKHEETFQLTNRWTGGQGGSTFENRGLTKTPWRDAREEEGRKRPGRGRGGGFSKSQETLDRLGRVHNAQNTRKKSTLTEGQQSWGKGNAGTLYYTRSKKEIWRTGIEGLFCGGKKPARKLSDYGKKNLGARRGEVSFVKKNDDELQTSGNQSPGVSRSNRGRRKRRTG